jgi:hypothetical protein
MKKLILILATFVFLTSCSHEESFTTPKNNPSVSQNQSKLALGQNVKLIKAKDSRIPSCSRGGCTSVQTREYVVEVANLALNKTVVAHQQLSNGQWEDVSLSYSFTTTSGTEIWTGTSTKSTLFFTTPAQNQFGEKLAVKYEVNGQTYWDNNNGADYYISNTNRTDNSSFLYMSEDFNILSTLPHNEPAIQSNANNTYINIAADVRNIAFAKEVKIIYTVNNWATSATKSLSFNSYENNNANTNYERWTIGFAIPKTTKVIYALSYKVNGVTYWDNNFGKNYTLMSY